MKDKEMIEELGQDIYDNCPQLCEDGCGNKFCYVCIAESLYHNGYRKISKDSVLISSEENLKWLDFLKFYKDKALKEMLEIFSTKVKECKTIKELVDLGYLVSYVDFCNDIDELARQFIVQIKDND